jgi:hypothetical protein
MATGWLVAFAVIGVLVAVVSGILVARYQQTECAAQGREAFATTGRGMCIRGEKRSLQPPLHRRIGHALLLDLAMRVALDLRERPVAGYGHDLMDAAPCLYKPPCSRLAEPVGVQAQASLPAPLPEPVAETGWREGLAVVGDEEGHVLARRRVEDGLQLGVDGDAEALVCFALAIQRFDRLQRAAIPYAPHQPPLGCI